MTNFDDEAEKLVNDADDITEKVFDILSTYVAASATNDMDRVALLCVSASSLFALSVLLAHDVAEGHLKTTASGKPFTPQNLLDDLVVGAKIKLNDLLDAKKQPN